VNRKSDAAEPAHILRVEARPPRGRAGPAPCPRSPLTSRIAAAAVILLAAAAARSAPAEEAVETVHYRLVAAAPREEAEELGRVLEAAWERFQAWFGAAPKLAQGEKLVVRLLPDLAAWEAGIRADGGTPPAGAGGYYWTGSRTAYLFRQPTIYYTRVLLLHEAAHQFHFLARTNNRNPLADWYTEGIAEYLSWHTWDGERLTLGVLPLLSLEDRAAGALTVVRDQSFDLAEVVEGKREADRPLCWALFRFLAIGDQGKPVGRFPAFCRKMDAGGAAGPAFKGQFGQARALRKKFHAWVEAEQQAWAPVFNEWEPIGDRRIRGVANVVSLCRLKAPANTLKATLEVPGQARFRGGLLLHFVDAGDYTTALVDEAGVVRVARRANDAWVSLGTTRLEEGGGGVRLLHARRDGARVRLEVDGRACGEFELPGRTLGLAVEDCDLSFRDLEWN